MFIRNAKRFNIYAAKEIDGVRYSHFRDPDTRAKLGITEIADPVRESDETHYVQEIDDAPYVINTPKSVEQLAEIAARKAEIAAQELLKEGVKADATMQNLFTKTDAEITTYVRTQIDAQGVTDLASAKAALVKMETLLGKLGVIVAALGRTTLKG